MSGNSVPVERAVISSKGFNHLVDKYLFSPIPLDELRECPFCNGKMDIKDPDTIYPTGILWKYYMYHEEGDCGKNYNILWEDVPDGECYKIVCLCGAEMHCDSREEVIKQWNQRK